MINNNRKNVKITAILFMMLLIFLLAYQVTPNEERQLTLLYLAGITTLLYTLLTGLLAVIISLITVTITFISTLPVISSVVAQTALIFAILYRWVFSVFFKKTIVRVPMFQTLNKKIMENPTTLKIKNKTDHFLTRIGFSHPRQYKILEVGRCPYCRSWKPQESRFCNTCGKNLRR